MISGLKWKEARTIFKENADDNIMDVTDFSIYYDLGTNEVATCRAIKFLDFSVLVFTVARANEGVVSWLHVNNA